MDFETIIGLEVHVQLNTKTKLFCSCKVGFGDAPNSNTCPVCLGLPGALPVPNKDAIKKACYLSQAINARLNRRSYFDRKNYFYPDLPSGYQISQLFTPIVEDGFIEVQSSGAKKIRIDRAHLESDAGKNIHDDNFSRVDLNRAGTPLLEIVSKPDMRSSDEAVEYLKKLHSIVSYINISDANMQEGSFRCDANVSIRPMGDDNLYTRVEIKNINSFRFIQKAIDLEVSRQKNAWENGEYETIVQETRGYDSVKNRTYSMRGKEESADYRYFPDPDLLVIEISDEFLSSLDSLPELADEKKERYLRDFGLNDYDASLISSDVACASYFDEMMKTKINPKNASSWLCVELGARLKKLELEYDKSPLKPSILADLVAKIEKKTISNKAAKDVLDLLMKEYIGVDRAIEKLGLAQVSDEASLVQIIDDILAKNQKELERFRSGETKLLGFFVGQVMKVSKGSADPIVVNKILKEKLN